MKFIIENKEYYKISFSLLKPYRKYYILFLLIKVLVISLQYITPIIYLVLVNDVMGNLESQKLPFVISAYVVVFIISTGLNIISRYTYNHIFYLLNLKLQCKLLKQFINTKHETVSSLNIGDLKNRISSDLGMVGKYLTTYSSDIILTVIFSIVLLVIMFSLSYILALCVLLVIPLSILFSNTLGKQSAVLSDEQRKRYGEYEGQVYDILNNWKEIKTNAIEEIMLERIQEQWNALAKISLKMQVISFFSKVFSRFKDFFLTQMSLYFIGGLLVLNGNLTVGVLVAFMSYFMQLLAKVSEMTDFIFNIKTDRPIAKRLFEVFSWPSTIGTINKVDHKDIEISNVTFNYPDAEDNQKVIKDVSISFAEKDYVALVGKSGCGKSTLAKLLMRLYTPSVGTIKIGGVDLSALTDSCLYRTINIVMQKPYIFNASLRDNLLLAKSNATEEELIEACKCAFIYDVIQSKPKGFETLIGENGVKFSGGQLQRLAIARILLLNPEIVIFDEATSSLDAQSEEMVLNAMKMISEKKTVISIAHRYSTFSRANKVIVLDEGKIVATGTLAELHGKIEAYDTLVKDQIILGSLE